MHKLNERQLDTLALIEDNPGRVEAVTRVVKGWLRINGNTERALRKFGLIEHSQGFELVTYFVHGEEWTHQARWWKLTEAGRDALRAATLAKV